MSVGIERGIILGYRNHEMRRCHIGWKDQDTTSISLASSCPRNYFQMLHRNEERGKSLTRLSISLEHLLRVSRRLKIGKKTIIFASLTVKHGHCCSPFQESESASRPSCKKLHRVSRKNLEPNRTYTDYMQSLQESSPLNSPQVMYCTS